MQQKLINFILILFFISIISLVFIKLQSNSKDKVKELITIPPSFSEFYTKFHSDSTFQISNILFPLKGIKFNTEGKQESIYWSKNDWKFHKAPQSFSQSYIVKLDIIDNLLIEKTTHNNYSFSMERRFLKSDDSYKLIFYKEMGPN